MKSSKAPSSTNCHTACGGFTLVELMISIALVVILILGINKVFQYTSQAVGQGQAITAAGRDSRAAQATFQNDFNAMIPNGQPPNAACLIINNIAVPAFRDRADEAGDKGVGVISSSSPSYRRELTIDIDGDGNEGDTKKPGEVISPLTYNFRNHRIDVLSFFARDVFPRQTGNNGFITADMSSDEAWIWYGHLWLPDNNGAYKVDTNGTPITFPGMGGSASLNPNNYYATQFVLGRVAMLLREKNQDAVGGIINDDNGKSQRFIDRQNPYPPRSAGPYANELEPLSANAQAASIPSDSQAFALRHSRFDLAATRISSFNYKLQSYLAPASGNVTGFYSSPASGNVAWWEQLMAGTPTLPSANQFPAPASANANDAIAGRFHCEPFAQKPLGAIAMAKASPYFLQGCSQFTVEFAGDFVTQNNDPSDCTPSPPFAASPSSNDGTYGEVLSAVSDGVLDFYVDKSSDPAYVANTPGTENPGLWRRQIRWYGLPRDTNGDAVAQGWYARAGRPLTNNDMPDVVPVRDVVRSCVYGGGFQTFNGFGFEKIINPLAPSGSNGNYADLTLAQTIEASGNPIPAYTCAFGPNDARVKLIRITITLTDSTGRLPDGITYQYIFTVPGN